MDSTHQNEFSKYAVPGSRTLGVAERGLERPARVWAAVGREGVDVQDARMGECPQLVDALASYSPSSSPSEPEASV